MFNYLGAQPSVLWLLLCLQTLLKAARPKVMIISLILAWGGLRENMDLNIYLYILKFIFTVERLPSVHTRDQTRARLKNETVLHVKLEGL